MLILPASQAISRKGVESIKTFVRNGGLAIADYPPAVMDEYLRPYGKPAVAEGQKVEFQTCPKCNGAKRIQVEGFWQTCPVCGGTGSTVKGGARPTKSILEDVFDFSKKGTKPCGKGYGLFLAGLPDKREEWAGLRKSLIETQGIRGDVEILDVLGNMRTDLTWHISDNGRAKFVGVLPPLAIATPPGKEFSVRLKEKPHGYNVRQHKYLGLAETFPSGISPTAPKLFVFLPERIEGIRLSVPKSAYRAGETVALGVSILPASLADCRLVVHVEVRRGDRILAEHTRNVSVPGAVQHPIPLALNQEPGEYRVRVMEIISGHVQEAAFRVK